MLGHQLLCVVLVLFVEWDYVDGCVWTPVACDSRKRWQVEFGLNHLCVDGFP